MPTRSDPSHDFFRRLPPRRHLLLRLLPRGCGGGFRCGSSGAAPASSSGPPFSNSLPSATSGPTTPLLHLHLLICDMVTVAYLLNLTLIVPELDKKSFWADTSNFGDIFDVRHFFDSLRSEVHIIKRLLKRLCRNISDDSLRLPPVIWSTDKYYLGQILPLFNKFNMIHFNKTDARLANNGLPAVLQKLRGRSRRAKENEVRNETLLVPEDLRHFNNWSSQMAAVDYMVSLASNVSIPTYDGNMAKVVEGHRRYLGIKESIVLDQRRTIELVDMYENKTLSWDMFESAVREG